MGLTVYKVQSKLSWILKLIQIQITCKYEILRTLCMIPSSNGIIVHFEEKFNPPFFATLKL
jgi:hypothetical protein